MEARAGLASGLVMGLGFVTGALGVPINGFIADHIGLQKSLMTHVILVLATIAIAWFLPRDDQLERLAVSQQAGPPVRPPDHWEPVHTKTAHVTLPY